MRKLLALLTLLVLLVPCAQAAELPYGEDTLISVLVLTPAQRSLADYLYTPIFNGETRIDLPQNTLYDDVSAAMGCLMQDYPELFHLGKNFTIGYYQHQPEYATWVEPQYRMSAREAASLRSTLYAQSYLLADSAASVEDLHDQLLNRVTYGGSTEMRHTAVGALLEGRATCEGYAQAMTLIYRMAGIPCGIVTGTAVDSTGHSERHSWNIVYVGGYALIDATWNDQDSLGMNTHWYYGLSTAQMGVDHFPDADQSIPTCGEQINWHRVRNYVVNSRAEADAAIRRLIAGETLNLRIPSGQLYAQLALDTYAYLTDYNTQNPRDGFYGSYSITKSDEQQCVVIMRGE